MKEAPLTVPATSLEDPSSLLFCCACEESVIVEEEIRWKRRSDVLLLEIILPERESCCEKVGHHGVRLPPRRSRELHHSLVLVSSSPFFEYNRCWMDPWRPLSIVVGGDRCIWGYRF